MRSGRSGRRGMRYGIPDREILCLARVIRACIVASFTRNALAISADDNPHTSRSVNAICAS